MAAAEETRILQQLDKFDGGIAKDYLRYVSDVRAKAGANALSWIKDQSGRDVAFRLGFGDMPILLLASHPISRFMREERYNVWRSERQFCATLGIIPVFFPGLNVYTILKLWNDPARRFFESEQAIPRETSVCWMFSPLGAASQYSSMNFILKFGARDELVEEGVGKLVNEYFVNAFWSFPKYGYASSTHFIHSSLMMRTAIKVAKSIYSIERMEESTIDTGYESIPVWKAKIWGLDFKDGKPILVSFPAVLTRDLKEKIQRDHSDMNFFINGVVSEFRRQTIRFHALTSIEVFGRNSLELYEALIGLVSMRGLSGSSEPCYVGRIQEVKTKVDELLRLLGGKIRYDRTVGDELPNLFEFALKDLSSIFPNDGDAIYYYHPFLLSSLSSLGLSKISKDKEALLLILKMLNAYSKNRSQMEVRKLPESDKLVSLGYDKEAAIKAIAKANKYIELSRLVATAQM